MSLWTNRLTGTLPASWANLPKSLDSLWLAYNRLTGTLPEAWARLTGLQMFDLRGNKLTGTLPPSWGNLTTLGYMGLAGNVGLTGTIPCTWSSMGSNATGGQNYHGGGGVLAQLELGGTTVKRCYPSASLKEAGDRADSDYYANDADIKLVSGVRGE
jgi:hypothetical protein